MSHDLCLPFDDPVAWVRYAAVKPEPDLALPFANIKRPRAKLFKVGKRNHRRLSAPPRNHRERYAAYSTPTPLPFNRNFRPAPKANVLVDIDCNRSRALQRVLYLESKRQVLVKWSGSNQWFAHAFAQVSRRFAPQPPPLHAGTCITEWVNPRWRA